eukprot:430932-Ditylum_brightwellii.AAC.1
MADASLDGQKLQSLHTQHMHHTDHSSVRICNPKQTLLLDQDCSPAVSNLSLITVHNDPGDQEQAMFEQRLCEDKFGITLWYVCHVLLFQLQSLHSNVTPLSTNASTHSAQHCNL